MNNFNYKINGRHGINNRGTLIFHNGKKIQTPVSWFGLSVIESKDFQIECFKRAKVESFVSNAYDLYYNDKKNERKQLINELQDLRIKHKMDSGGFQLMKAKIKQKASKFPLTPKMVLDKQLEVGCECGVQLDFPFGPELEKKEKMERMEETLRNLEKLIEIINENGIEFTFLPVIHTVSDNLDLLEYGLNKLEDILGTLPKIIGIGSLVPLVKTIKGSRKYRIENFIYTLICLRKMLPDSFIHAFGIGGTMAYLAILAGIDSYDSNGWIQKAAYGVIQLPGISDRYLKKKDHNRTYLMEDRKLRNTNKIVNEIDMFMKCECSACKSFKIKDWKKKNWKKKQEKFLGREQEPKKLRAIHNLSLFQNEIFEMRRAIEEDRLLDFVKDRLGNSIYFKYIDFIERLKKLDLDEMGNFQSLLSLENKKISEFI